MTDPAPASAPIRERRSSVIIRALVETRDDAVDCRVRNLSASGACIDNDLRLSAGTRVLVTMGTLHRIRAEVVWANPRLAGLRFEGVVVDIDSARRPRGTMAAVTSIGAGWLAQIDDPYHRRHD